MDAPFKPTVQSKHDFGASDRGARKFDAKEREDPFAQAEEAKPHAKHKQDMLLDKFDLARFDLLDEMNQKNALQLK